MFILHTDTQTYIYNININGDPAKRRARTAHMLKVATVRVMNCRLSSAGHMMIYLICFEFHSTCMQRKVARATNVRAFGE